MVIEYRLYKKFDMDLIALYNMHYPIATMMRDAVMAYANGRPLHYYVDEPTVFNVDDCDAVHSRFVVPDSDVITCYMLKHLKFRCKNAFVKTVLRNALVQQNLTCFFTDGALNQAHLHNAASLNIQMLPNVIRCSDIKDNKKRVRKKTKTVDNSNVTGYTSGNKKSRNNVKSSVSTPFDVSAVLSTHDALAMTQNVPRNTMPNGQIYNGQPQGQPPFTMPLQQGPFIPPGAQGYPSQEIPQSYIPSNGYGNSNNTEYGYNGNSYYTPQQGQIQQTPVWGFTDQIRGQQGIPNNYIPQPSQIPVPQPQMQQQAQEQVLPHNNGYNEYSAASTSADSYNEDVAESEEYKTEETPEIQLAGNADLMSIFDNL